MDTGAAKSFISVDVVEEINIAFEGGDYITTVYGIGGPDNSFQKLIDVIEFGSKKLENYMIDFGAFHGDYNVNGLIGLDILRDAGVTIDLNDEINGKLLDFLNAINERAEKMPISVDDITKEVEEVRISNYGKI